MKVVCSWCENSEMTAIGEWYAGWVFKCINCHHEKLIVDLETKIEGCG